MTDFKITWGKDWGARGVAETIFDSQYIIGRCESIIYNTIYKFFERSKEMDEFKRFDYYDNSIELWTCPDNELSQEEQECLWILGFDRCWVCYRETIDGPQIGEKYYYKSLD